uniref:Carboxylesterase type B domain-containing protein n=1 Tax=Ciona savignyi TaxID=51511 RepID=H2Z724_CIOSA
MFNQTWSFPEFWENYTACYDLVCHSAELPYLFDLDKLTPLTFTVEEQQLANDMIAYWSNFAKTGNPNGITSNRKISKVTQQHWPRLYETPGQYSSLELAASKVSTLVNYVSNQCDFLDELDLYLKDDLKFRDTLSTLKDFLRPEKEQVNEFVIV